MSFARAQRAYDAMEPPDWDGVDVLERECDAKVEGVVFDGRGEEVDIEVECDFAGKVDVYYAQTEEHWDCPKCKTEHIIERD